MGIQARSMEAAWRGEIREEPRRPPAVGDGAIKRGNERSPGPIGDGINGFRARGNLSEIKLGHRGQSRAPSGSGRRKGAISAAGAIWRSCIRALDLVRERRE